MVICLYFLYHNKMDIMKTFEIFLSIPRSIISGDFINILHLDYKDNFFKAKSSISVDKIGDTTQITVLNNKKVYSLLTTVMYKRKKLYENKISTVP